MARLILFAVLAFPWVLYASDARKVVVVTGVSSGIAQAVVERFARDPQYKAYGTTRKGSITGSQDDGYILVQMDPGDTESVKNAFKKIIKAEGRVDVLVNSAGYMVLGSVESIDPDDQLLKLFNVNVVGYARTTQAVVPVMREIGGGRVINVTSIQALEPRGLQESYSATRSAVETMSMGQSSYLKDDNIDVIVYEPGATRTGIMSSSPQGSIKVKGDKTLPLMSDFVEMLDKRLGQGVPADEVAEQIFALADQVQPDFRNFATPAVQGRAGAVYKDPTGNTLRALVRDKYEKFVNSVKDKFQN
ncbi:SDR family NAD(P)-dependent oxidoreductase [Endozoicomonas arenosclerae]|uniref:SDR family NAD(P)-dependent oxidoreductase n=1 Tax=Endozoicomonas arenosclerae TaxID=1633495 RepID=UPI0007860F5D|nr:SDR family NAD(P)-dependent oxidoreductase [Endozoicomonas arenosclerae]